MILNIVPGRANSKPGPRIFQNSKGFYIRVKKRKENYFFLNTHNLDEAQRLCDKIGILNTKLRAIGNSKRA